MPTRAGTGAVAALTALALVWLASGLPAGAFFSGDSGVKLIATLDAIAHPTRPFEADLPRVGTRATTFTDPMVVPHGLHAHVLQSPLFPPLTAPLVAAFGLRGAYVWPALAFVALVPLLGVARRHLVPETSWAVLAWIVVAANPLFFYALEFWEHAPAVALLAAGTAMVATVLVGVGVTGGGHPIGSAARRVSAAGALVGAGVLLRPEGAWYAAGLAFVLGPRLWLPFGGGAAALLLPAAALNSVHFGNPLGAHASAVLGPIGESFLAARWQRVREWLWPASALEGAALTLVAVAWLAAALKVDVRTRQLGALAGVAIVALLAATRALSIPSFWQGFPLALLALVPAVTRSPGARRLGTAALVAVAGVVLTATNDGGAQWGTRYLLVAAPPLLLLAARGATEASGDGRWRTPRLALLGVILLAGAATSRNAYLELRGAKRDYHGLVAAVASVAPPGALVVSNAWWLDQIAAALHRTRTFLYVPDQAAAVRALATIRDERIDSVTLVWSGTESPFPLESALEGTCFRIVGARDVSLRSLRLVLARCAAD